MDKIATEKTGDDRLDENEYIPWNEKDFRLFLEQKCKLSKGNKIMDRIIKEHDQAFYFWEELIGMKLIEFPFYVTHIDAHTDLKAGYPSNALNYILENLLHIPISRRLKEFNRNEMGPANYLSFAIACGLFNNVELVIHPDFTYCDLPILLFKDCTIDSGKLEMKAYENKVLQYSNFNNPISKDQEIPFQINPLKKFQSQDHYDFLIFCQSLGYTPKTADFMIEIIKEYIVKV